MYVHTDLLINWKKRFFLEKKRKKRCSKLMKAFVTVKFCQNCTFSSMCMFPCMEIHIFWSCVWPLCCGGFFEQKTCFLLVLWTTITREATLKYELTLVYGKWFQASSLHKLYNFLKIVGVFVAANQKELDWQLGFLKCTASLLPVSIYSVASQFASQLFFVSSLRSLDHLTKATGHDIKR